MKSDSRMLISIASFAVSMFAASGFAFAQSGSIDLPSLGKGTIFIWNGTTKSVIFYLSPDNKNFERHEIAADGTDSPQFGVNVPEIHFRIKTGEAIIDRSLKPQTRYQIFLSEEKTFDIREIKR